ncbi:MAG: type II toxin-antitoxin system PemK/MazF family toxin [Pyrinomonadaceae bacterium]|nr:type II toxin-antitoxin system PemK/MazF family toxin [Pyrinomonadaceae bacterium]
MDATHFTRRTRTSRQTTKYNRPKDTTLPTVLLVPLTTQQDALRFQGTVLIEPDSQNNLPNISVALAFQLTALDKNSLERRIGKISDDKLAEIWQAFDEITGRI